MKMHKIPRTLALRSGLCGLGSLERSFQRHGKGTFLSLPLRHARRFWQALFTRQHEDHEDFYRYSSGRWLWDEDVQLKQRYKRFEVSELKKIAASSSGAQKCVSMVKLAEGGSNKVFRLVMDNGSVVIARIPNPNAGPPFKTTASEVATMDFASTILGIPVPKVFSWSADAANPVQSEYILMEEAVGTQLEEEWDGMELEQKFSVVDDIIAIEGKLLSLSFTCSGNLYFSGDSFQGCETAIVEGDISTSLRADIEKRYVIGPVADEHFWSAERASMQLDRGPWSSPRDYLKAIGRREISWLSQHAGEGSTGSLYGRSKAQRTAEAHIELYQRFLDVADHLLPSDRKLVRATLWHWDIHAPNIFVKENKVTGLIDWQGAWAGPLFLQARQPRLVDYDGELILKLPANFSSLQDKEERARLESQVERSILLWSYESDTKKANPVLHEIYHLPHGRTRRQVVDYSTNTWDGDIIPFRQCLIRVERYWNEICRGVPCPITFSEEEIKAHLRDGEGWNESADFWDSVADVLHRDGWTSNENYEKAVELFAQLERKGSHGLSCDERAESEQRTP